MTIELETKTNAELKQVVMDAMTAIHLLTGFLPGLAAAAHRLDPPPDLPEPSRSGHYS